MSISFSAIREARRMFCPSLPIACARSSSATTTTRRVSVTGMIRFTSAGANTRRIRSDSSSVQLMISIRSLDNSRTIACTRLPRIPTHAPTGSTRLSFVVTAIFERWPGSRTTFTIRMVPSLISGTSSSNSRLRNSGDARDTMTCGPLGLLRTSATHARTASP